MQPAGLRDALAAQLGATTYPSHSTDTPAGNTPGSLVPGQTAAGLVVFLDNDAVLPFLTHAAETLA
jgi:hypothetical protein